MYKFHGVAHYRGKSWNAEVRYESGEAICSQATSWKKVREMVREAASWRLGVPSEEVEVVLTPGDPELAAMVEEKFTSQREAQQAKERADRVLVSTVKRMTPHYTFRDIGHILGISHGYAEKLSKL